MYRPISESREVPSKGRIRPIQHSRPASRLTEGSEHDNLTFRYYETLSKPRAEIFAYRPPSAAEGKYESVRCNSIAAPEVVRASTPFLFNSQLRQPSTRPPTALPTSRLPPLSGEGQFGPSESVALEPEPTFVELSNAVDADLSSFGVGRNSIRRMSNTGGPSSRPGTASSNTDKLVCYVGDKPMSYYNSPLRRGPGRLRSAGALALSLRSQAKLNIDNAPLLTQNDITRERLRLSSSKDTQLRLNKLLRCASAASRGPSPK